VLFNEPKLLKSANFESALFRFQGFSALQRAEIAEIPPGVRARDFQMRFSALQRAEIAEMDDNAAALSGDHPFQCSSTSRNC